MTLESEALTVQAMANLKYREQRPRKIMWSKTSQTPDDLIKRPIDGLYIDDPKVNKQLRLAIVRGYTLELINSYRAHHVNTEPLIIDFELTHAAQELAEFMSHKNNNGWMCEKNIKCKCETVEKFADTCVFEAFQQQGVYRYGKKHNGLTSAKRSPIKPFIEHTIERLYKKCELQFLDDFAKRHEPFHRKDCKFHLKWTCDDWGQSLWYEPEGWVMSQMGNCMTKVYFTDIAIKC